MENDIVTFPEKDTPQGSLISPLLMNIALYEMEKAVIEYVMNLNIKNSDGKSLVKRRRSSSISSISIIRYADAFVIPHANNIVIESCKIFIQNYLTKISLKLKESKTRICYTLNSYDN